MLKIQNAGWDSTDHIFVNALGDGVTDNTSVIQAALDVGGNIILPSGGVFKCNGLSVTTNCILDLQGSTIIRGSDTGVIIDVSGGGRFEIRNGTLDGDNRAANGEHFLYYRDSTGHLIVDNVTMQNNCAGSPTPTTSQDTDLLYVLYAGSATFINSKFKLASRNGISITGACENVTIQNCLFEDCYLFGFDYEPNSVSTHMCQNLTVVNNKFKNNGPKNPPTDYVWNTGGPINVSSGADHSINFVKTVVFSDNIIESSDFLNASGSYNEPYMRFDQFKTLIFANNSVDNLGFTNFSPNGTSTMGSAQIVGNTFSKTGTQDNYITTGPYLQNVNVSNNRLHYIYARSPNITISGNTFLDSTLGEAIHCFSTCLHAAITGNVFNGITTCISVADKSSGYTVTGNRATGHTTFIGTVTSSVVSGNTDGKMQGLALSAKTGTVSVPTATATTLIDLAGVKQTGMISVYDASGTRLGSYALFGNFYDGANNSAFLTAVQNSGISGSALTLSGTQIQFYHTYGSTRTISYTLSYAPG